MKIAVVGAGPAGLSAALELKHLGFDVDTYESHSKPGGCASYFKRKFTDPSTASEVHTVLFDAGATVLWNLSPGDFLHSLLRKWKIDGLNFQKHPKHLFSLNGYSFALNAESPTLWTESLLEKFPKDAHFINLYFDRFFKVSIELNKLLYSLPAEPFLEAQNIIKNLKLAPILLKIAPEYLKLPSKFSDLIHNCSQEFKTWMESMLLITLQAKAEEVETLYGISALCFYALGAGSLDGGMAALFQKMAKAANEDKARLYFSNPVTKVNLGGGYILESPLLGIKKYDALFLSTPRWNSKKLFDVKLFADDHTLDWDYIHEKLWSAVVCYFVFKDEEKIPSHSFNHLVKTSDGDFYFSVSARDTTERAPKGYRVATASTHEKLYKWNFDKYIKKKPFPEREIYEEMKKTWSHKFSNAAKEVFNSSPLFVELGSPKTFEAYTQRKEGFVGGIPLTSDYSFFKSPSQSTLLSNVFQIGDTAFPGQSIANTCIGALIATQKLRF